MCVTRVARVVSVEGDQAEVEFVDGGTRSVDVSTVEARVGGYLEVFADQALAALSEAEAEWKRQAWSGLPRRPGDAAPLGRTA